MEGPHSKSGLCVYVWRKRPVLTCIHICEHKYRHTCTNVEPYMYVYARTYISQYVKMYKWIEWGPDQQSRIKVHTYITYTRRTYDQAYMLSKRTYARTYMPTCTYIRHVHTYTLKVRRFEKLQHQDTSCILEYVIAYTNICTHLCIPEYNYWLSAESSKIILTLRYVCMYVRSRKI